MFTCLKQNNNNNTCTIVFLITSHCMYYYTFYYETHIDPLLDLYTRRLALVFIEWSVVLIIVKT